MRDQLGAHEYSAYLEIAGIDDQFQKCKKRSATGIGCVEAARTGPARAYGRLAHGDRAELLPDADVARVLVSPAADRDGCTESSPEKVECISLVEAIEAYEQKW